jgi:hypothetical protein
MFKSLRGGLPKRIKVFSASLVVHVDTDPVFSGSVMGVGVADKQSGFRGQTIGTEDSLKSLDRLQKLFDFDSIHF